MDGNPPDEPDASVTPKAKRKGWPLAALQEDKKTVFWMGGVMDCFSTVLSLFSKTDTSPAKDDDWEVPFDEMSGFLYLGAGAQGIVFRSNLRGEMVAVKKLRDKSETNIKHLRKLHHENIVRFRGVSINGPVPCIIMEYCQYGPLFEFLHSSARISASQTFRWAKDIAVGMSYLHANKIIHRDLKSPNILIADNLIVKVSDFGTAREWNDVSAVMSFTGTVAWMAPEVIRHEPCSERVDVWSYGVVLWELLTQEVPYKNIETHAIMWGVGTDTMSLPIPTSCPTSIQTLLKHCWNRTPRHRPPFNVIAANLEMVDEDEIEMYQSGDLAVGGPPFKIIAANLEIAGDEFAESQDDSFSATQVTWRKEIQEGMKFVVRTTPKTESPPAKVPSRRDELRHARDVRIVYEQQLSRANELYMEVCAVRLQLEQREKDVAEREKALTGCRCGIRKNLKHLQRQTSSSSDNFKANIAELDLHGKKKEAPAQVVVNYVDKGEKTVSVAVKKEKVSQAMKDVACCVSIESVDNNNLATVKPRPAPVTMHETTIRMKNLVMEQNGNIVKQSKKKRSVNDNYIPDIAHV